MKRWLNYLDEKIIDFLARQFIATIRRRNRRIGIEDRSRYEGIRFFNAGGGSLVYDVRLPDTARPSVLADQVA